MSKKKKPHPPEGKVRRSQVITTFGPGAMLDLPKHSVLIGGLDQWRMPPEEEEVIEPRLVEKLKKVLEVDSLYLRLPPAFSDDEIDSKTGIGVWLFPEYFVSAIVKRPDTKPEIRSRLLVHRRQLDGKTKIEYGEGSQRKKYEVVPVRFVCACVNGHIDELPWRRFVGCPDRCKRQLWMDEEGTSSDLSEITVLCECGRSRSMTDAANKDLHAVGKCRGKQLWLGKASESECGEWSRLLIRTASNSYFPQKLSVISLPEADEDLAIAVDQAWPHIKFAESIEDIKYERQKKPPVKNALQGFTDDQVFTEVRRRTKGGGAAKEVKLAEFETLAQTKAEIGEDRPDGIFHARTLDSKYWNKPWMDGIERVVLVHRLREVTAQAGFTRFEAVAPDVSGELDVGVKRAPLAADISWVPAVENKGEGIFVQFSRAKVESWLKKSKVQDREKSLKDGFTAWLAEHPTSKRKFPGVAYVMLHSFSHHLLTAIALECGYPSSSLRERIYAIKDVGFGILIFTGTSDAEGTLGGLVESGRRIDQQVIAALHLGMLCSNDPVCAEHEPKDDNERRFLHGAACHGCLLTAETSCEQHNDFLDRSLVVPTVDDVGAEFFTCDGID